MVGALSVALRELSRVAEGIAVTSIERLLTSRRGDDGTCVTGSQSNSALTSQIVEESSNAAPHSLRENSRGTGYDEKLEAKTARLVLASSYEVVDVERCFFVLRKCFDLDVDGEMAVDAR